MCIKMTTPPWAFSVEPDDEIHEYYLVDSVYVGRYRTADLMIRGARKNGAVQCTVHARGRPPRVYIEDQPRGEFIPREIVSLLMRGIFTAKIYTVAD